LWVDWSNAVPSRELSIPTRSANFCFVFCGSQGGAVLIPMKPAAAPVQRTIGGVLDPEHRRAAFDAAAVYFARLASWSSGDAKLSEYPQNRLMGDAKHRPDLRERAFLCPIEARHQLRIARNDLAVVPTFSHWRLLERGPGPRIWVDIAVRAVDLLQGRR
jgi:hypothetical protein